MHVFEHISEVRTFLEQQRLTGKSIGLVPTMGALHVGHVSLVKASINENDLTVSSIFVNPAQFNNPSDLEKYPRTFDEDAAALEKAGCSILFCPPSKEMYPDRKPGIDLLFKGMDSILEGEFRPGHFSGVGIVVSKLFNIIKPDRAYFGQKDLQQFHVIRQLVTDLSFDVTLRCMPIVREASGLAMSSRNSRLNDDERTRASVLFESLTKARHSIEEGHDLLMIREMVTDMVSAKGMRLEYFHIIDVETFSILHKVVKEGSLALCIAAYMGEVRLIDNLLLQ